MKLIFGADHFVLEGVTVHWLFAEEQELSHWVASLILNVLITDFEDSEMETHFAKVLLVLPPNLSVERVLQLEYPTIDMLGIQFVLLKVLLCAVDRLQLVGSDVLDDSR